MLRNLNYWKTTVLLTPFIAGLVSMTIALNHSTSNTGFATIANYLLPIGIAIPVTCQAYLITDFISAANKKDLYITINTWIPVVFFMVYSVYMVVHSFNKQPRLLSKVPPHLNSAMGPVGQTQIHGINLAVELFLIYAFINFLFTNNNYVSWQLKKITDTDKQNELRNNYLKPMQIIVRSSLYVFGTFILITAIMDIAKIV